MVKNHITLENPERFASEYTISREKLIRAAERATDKLEYITKRDGCGFPGTCSVNYKYQRGANDNWETGMYTGCFWLAYQLTGNKYFREIAESHFDSYVERFKTKKGLGGHDVGFPYMPSCVAQYKVTGDEAAKNLALDVARYFVGNAYMTKGENKFIKRTGVPYRTMMDTLMNATLLLWAGKETGDPFLTEAGLNQSVTTEKFLIREDASSFHHYMFNENDCSPIRGLTLQGNSDDSCWSRGHSWGVYGLAIAYSYTGAEFLPPLHKDVAYFMLNHLPSDCIPYWDYDFTDGSEPRDASAACISACGMLEMASLLPDSAEQKSIFRSAAAQMLDSVIDNCTDENGFEYDGLVYRVTHAKPQGQGFDECAVYGDYFYLEALARNILPEFKMHW